MASTFYQHAQNRQRPSPAHLQPLLGRMPVAAVTRSDIEGAMHAIAEGKPRAAPKPSLAPARVRGGRGTSARAIGLLGGIFTYAVRHGWRADSSVHGVIRFADGRRERLSDDEFAALRMHAHARAYLYK